MGASVDILGTALSGLRAFQRGLATTSHNIANVNTEGYSRQRVELINREGKATGSGFLGVGVDSSTTKRLFNEFLATQVRSSATATAQLEVMHEYAGQLDNRFADSSTGLAPVINEFFSALNGLADDPASLPARQVVLARMDALLDRFHSLDRGVSELGERLNGELEATVNEINTLASVIADLNIRVMHEFAEGGGQAPNDLLDQRDHALDALSEQVAITTVSQDDGAINVLIGNGQSLVVGTLASKLAVASREYDAQHLEVEVEGVRITGGLAGGKIGGLLGVRNEVLDPARNHLGRLAVGFAEDLNKQNRLGMDLEGQLGRDVFGSPTPQMFANSANSDVSVLPFQVQIVDSSQLTTSDYELRFLGGTRYALTRVSDGQSFPLDASDPTTLTVDGLTFAASASGLLTEGDRFLIRPTYRAASQISRAIQDARHLAAAGPVRSQPAVDSNGSSINKGDATITQPTITSTNILPLRENPVNGILELTFDAALPGFQLNPDPTGSGALAYDPGMDSDGKRFTLPAYGGLTFIVAGNPKDGDRFIISDNDAGVADSRNALRLAALANEGRLEEGKASYSAAYGQLVSSIGTKARAAEINLQAQEGLLSQARQAHQSHSGVNLDEEAANLLKYQQAYEASARVVAVANSIFQTILAATDT